MSVFRLRDSEDEEEQDAEESLLPRALEVPSGSESEEDAAGLPSSALQYLRYVRREQAKQAEVATADLSKLRIKSASSGKQPSSSPEDCAADGPRLSQQWQQRAESEFSDLRCRLSRWRARHAPPLRRAAAKLPPADDRAAWLAVCRGSSEGATAAADLAPPSLHTVAACTQRQLHRLLEHLLAWSADHQSLGCGRAAWLFAVMAALEKPLPADTCSCLRQAARLCRASRGKMAPDDPRYPAACLLICLVGRYFGQTDLADPGPPSPGLPEVT